MLLKIHLLGENCFALTFCWRQMRGWFSGWFNVWHSRWMQNSFPGRATLESQQGDMKQSQACDALPQYRVPFHSHIPRFISGIYLPSPPLGGNSIWNFTSPLFLSLTPAPVSSSRDGWAPHSGVSQPVHHALRLGIKNCKPFTIASHIFLQHLHPTSSPQPRLSPKHTCHNITIKESLTVTIRTTFPRSPTCDPQPRYSKHLHSSKWGVKKHNLFCTSQIIYFFFLSLLQEFSISL